MKKLINKFNLFSLAVLTTFAFSISSCSEDVINPDHSMMPPKNQIKTPPRKN